MDGSILLNGVVTNTTETTLNYQYLGIIIATVGALLGLGALIFKVGKELGEMRGTKEVVEGRLELIEEKYNTYEKFEERLNAERAATDVKFNSQLREFRNLESQLDIITKNLGFLAISSG